MAEFTMEDVDKQVEEIRNKYRQPKQPGQPKQPRQLLPEQRRNVLDALLEKAKGIKKPGGGELQV
ncbi:unnamed protein product [marine sediment metagenome]|uniref:Uncharacterized protein n=1 Tax=marine sediment metagenome TaxID=412755 RepID=X1E8Q4_9ZZZZ